LRQAIDRADSILYLLDNAGEIAFDKLLIKQLPANRVTAVVKGGPAINDVCMTDADAVGLSEVADVIDNGSDVPGTVLKDCSDDFQKRFAQVDLIIAKRQGNYETLSHQSQRPSNR